MKISLNWLKSYIDTDLSVEKISELLTGCGLEVEGVEPFETIKGGLEGVVTGKVLSCSKHPNADKLSITTVDIGGEQALNIVCGAPNVAAGQKVLVATVGTTIYKGEESFQIKEAKIRGELSQGMICAEDELGLGESHAGIMVLPAEVAVGVKASDYFEIYTDSILEIGLTPNRSDAYSHTGVARDLVALLNVHQLTEKEKVKLLWPDVSSFQVDDSSLVIPISVEDNIACPRYCGLSLSDVIIDESPVWMQNLLKAAGMRPINNIVDITNFVLLETGQPLHAFDADKITGGKVIVKKLAANTLFTSLDGVERKLSSEDLMICNTEEPMCMAGVYGGLNSGVTQNTKRIFLESAYFNAVSVRKSSRIHGLKTDSSQRFERGANPEMTIYAMKRAALLMKQYAAARITSTIQDIYPSVVEGKKINITYKNIDKIIGKTIPHELVKSILTNLEINIISETQEGLSLVVPPFKVDVDREADVAEEILRIYGYNNIELSDEIRYSMVISSGVDKERVRDLLSDHLCSQGFSEIMCNSLTKAEYTEILKDIEAASYVRILNPLSRDLEYMRRSLLFGGLETLLHNQNRKVSDLKLYEFGSVYQYMPELQTDNKHDRYKEEENFCLWLSGKRNLESWQEGLVDVNFYYLKSMINSMMLKIGIEKDQFEVKAATNNIFSEGLAYWSGENEILLEYGEVAPHILKAFDIKTPVFYAVIRWGILLKLIADHSVKYSELPRFPWVRRDLALLLDKNISYSEIEKLAFETETNLLKKVNLFDIYEGDKIDSGKKSYAISFVLQDDVKTLTDEEIERVMKKLLKKFGEKLGAVIR